MEKIFNKIEELEDFIKEKSNTDTVIYARELDNGTFSVYTEPRKKYISFDGKEFPEEVWVTKDHRVIQIQDLTEAHAKNIIRMIMRQRREMANHINSMMTDHLDNLIDDAEDEAMYTDESIEDDTPRVYH